jgi:hypothetical protein
MTDDHSTDIQQPPTPNPDLSGLERLVGTWNVSGGARAPAFLLGVRFVRG